MTETTVQQKIYTCARFTKIIIRVVDSCHKCLKDFHPSCRTDMSHKIYDNDNTLIPCDEIVETISLMHIKKLNKWKKIDNQNGENDNTEYIYEERDEQRGYKEIDYQQMEQLFENKIDRILVKMDDINGRNFSYLKSEIKHNIKQECALLKTTIEDAMEVKLSNITSKLYKEIDTIKNTITQLIPTTRPNDNTPTSSNSYSSIVKRKNSNTTKSNSERIIIKHKNQDHNSAETIKMIKNSVDVTKLGIGITKMINTDNGKVFIDVNKEADKVTLSDEIQNKLGDVVTVTPVTKKLPKLKIVKLDQSILQLNDKDFIHKLCTQNDIDTNSNNVKVKVVKKYCTKQGYGSILLEVNTNVHKMLLEKRKINFGWTNYRVYDFVDIVRCFKCWGFNHFKDNCTKSVTCRKCAGDHSDEECRNENLKCINCANFAMKNKSSDANLHHEATSHKCPCYVRMIERKKKDVMYECE